MAAKVNTRFVVIVAVSVIAAVVAVALLGYQAVKKSGEDYVTLGDRAMAEQKYPEATGFYAKAVFKDQRNSEWIRKWIAAMEKSVPESEAKYREEYQGQYTNALRALADSDRNDLESHRRFLDLRLKEVRMARSSVSAQIAAHEGMVRLADDLIEHYQGNDPKGDTLLRYRGLPKVTLLALNPDLPDAEIDAAKSDLQKAVAADPTDVESVIALSRLDIALAQRAAKRMDDEDQRRLYDAARGRLTTFIAEHPPAPRARTMALLLDLIDATDNPEQKVTAEEVLQDRQPQIREILTALKQEDPEEVDSATVFEAVRFARAALPVEEGKAEIGELIRHLERACADDALMQMMVAQVHLLLGQQAEALDNLKRIIEMPDRPMSLDGLLLFEARIRAIVMQTDIVFGQWEAERDPAKKAELAAKAKAYRDQLAAKIGETHNTILSLDGRLALIAGDLNGARTLLTKFNEQTGQIDESSMALLGEILMRQGNTGAAKSQFERVLQLRSDNQRALRQLWQIEAQAKNYPEASRYLGRLAALNPESKELRDQKAMLDAIVTGSSSDPWVQTAIEVESKTRGVGADLSAAIDIVEKYIQKSTGKPDMRPYATLYQLYIASNNRDKAEQTIDRAIAVFPDDKNLLAVKERLRQQDPVADQLAAIDAAATLSPLEKAVQKFDLAIASDNKPLAKSMLDEMTRIAPDDPGVVERRFQDAIQRKDTTLIAELAALAERKNLDQVNGLLFKARRELVEDRFAEAEQSLRAALERDRLNQVAWRLLGFVLLRQDKPQQAVEALAKAVEIRPADIQAVNAHLRALQATGNLTEMLREALKREPIAGPNPEFAELLIFALSSAPGGDKDRAAALREKLAASNPDNKSNRAELALLMMDQRRFDDAKKLIDEFRADPENAEAVVQLDARWNAVQGRFAQAEKAYDDYIKAQPAEKLSAGVYLAASRLFAGVGQPDRALAYLERGRALESPETMLISRETGDVLFNAGKYAEAAVAYRRVLDAGSKDVGDAVAKRILECYINTAEWAKFDEMMSSMGEKARADATLILLSAEAALRQDDPSRAARLFDQAVVAEPQNWLVYMKRADFNARNPDKFRDAVADFEQAARLAPTSTVPLQRLALLYRATGRIEQAADRLADALVVDPTDDGVRAELINLRLALNQNDRAVTLAEDAIRAKPGHVGWLMRTADLLSRLDRNAVAAQHLAAAWELQKTLDVAAAYVSALLAKQPPDPAAAWRVATDKALDAGDELPTRMLKAFVLERSGRSADADAELLKAYATLDHDNAQQVQIFARNLEGIYKDDTAKIIAALRKLDTARRLTGWAYVQAGTLFMRDAALADRAAADMEKFADQSSDASLKLSVYRVLGIFHYQMKRFAEAAALYRKFLTFSPGDPEVLNNIAYILATELKQPGDALPYAERAHELIPTSAQVLDTLAMCRLGLGNTDAAIADLEKAVTLARSNNELAPITLHLAQAHLKAGRKPEAREALDRARTAIESDANLKPQYENLLKDVQQQLDSQ